MLINNDVPKGSQQCRKIINYGFWFEGNIWDSDKRSLNAG